MSYVSAFFDQILAKRNFPEISVSASFQMLKESKFLLKLDKTNKRLLIEMSIY